MKRKILIFFFLTIIFSTFVFAEAEKKPFTVDDALNMDRISNPQISPNGNWILFTREIIVF